jgi:DNA-directed RNA polymerase specialized sigma24 family protein
MTVRRRAWRESLHAVLDAGKLTSLPADADGSRLPAGRTPLWAVEGEASLDQRIDDSRRREQLRGLIASLPEREREVMERHYLGDVPMRRVAGGLRVCLSTAYRLRGLALERLRAAADRRLPTARHRPPLKLKRHSPHRVKVPLDKRGIGATNPALRPQNRVRMR